MNPPLNVDIDRLCVNTLRFLAVDAVEKANSGHPGTPMEAAGLGYVLWTRLLKHNPVDPQWPNRDRFVLSAGHASMLLYGLLHLTGYDLPLEELKNFRQWGSRTPGHPEVGHTVGVETTTGPLGQGFGNGVGMAMAERLLADRFNRPSFPIVDHCVWAFVSDGDLMEGVVAEAASLAGHLKLGKLKYVYLDNQITIEGSTGLAFSENVAQRFEAYGWRVLHVPNPEDLATVQSVFETARDISDQPTLIIARTHIGFGSPNKQDTADAHGSPLGPKETTLTKQNLGWPESPPFHIPEEARDQWAKTSHRGREAQSQWETMLSHYKRAHPDLYKEWDSLKNTTLSEGWDKALPTFKPGDSLATRQASGKIINALAPHLKALVGGSADLAPSNNTAIDREGDFSSSATGRNLHFGIREHAMGSVMNGMALSGGVIPFGATFLTFADYMRPAIRLAALMKLGIIYVFTHDSIGVGEDGPTHQPVEHLASLRSIPGLSVIRPADANETTQAWRSAIERRHGPTALILSRQKLPTWDRSVYASAEGVLRGGYRMTEEGPVDVLLIATGSEIPLAMTANLKMRDEGISSAVINMASLNLFEKQDKAYQESVLPPSVRARVIVEAGVSFGWHRYAGPEGELVTLDRFGASAPGEIALEKLGFTVNAVIQAAHQSLARVRRAPLKETIR
ncbi:MAG: transketolase [Elusimicrobia bacterium]|jgi:transketolase|nr:transketolase [Elusimicrobiota bacterium]